MLLVIIIIILVVLITLATAYLLFMPKENYKCYIDKDGGLAGFTHDGLSWTPSAETYAALITRIKTTRPGSKWVAFTAPDNAAGGGMFLFTSTLATLPAESATLKVVGNLSDPACSVPRGQGINAIKSGCKGDTNIPGCNDKSHLGFAGVDCGANCNVTFTIYPII